MPIFRQIFRRTWLLAALGLGIALWAKGAASQGVEVPIRLQVELLAKVVAYDRSFPTRAGERPLILIVVKPGDPESERIGDQLLAELRVLSEIGGRPHTEEKISYATPASLADLVRRRTPAVIYVSAGLAEQMSDIANALDGISVLSVGVTAGYVSRRAVLGFDVESGKPKLVVHLGQARRQQVAFRPELLRLALVIQ